MNRAADTLEKITGVRPVGSRTASWDFSPHTLRITKEMGLLYDSSLMADEDCYELILEGEPTGVVELPVEWVRDDAVYFVMHRFQSLRPQMPTEAVLEHLPPRVRRGLRGRRHLPDHLPSAHHRLSLAHLDHRGADPPREVAAGRVVRDPCGRRRLRQGARRLMRIAVLADIHGNVRALRAVMDDLKQVAPDRVRQSRRHRVGSARSGRDRRRADQPRLDHDPRQPRPAGCSTSRRTRWACPTRRRSAELKNHHTAWLSTLEATAEVEDLFLCHGTPDSDNTYLLETVEPDGQVRHRDAGRSEAAPRRHQRAHRAVRPHPCAAHRRARRRPR